MDELDKIIGKLHSDGALMGLTNDGKPHKMYSHATGDKCEQQARAALLDWHNTQLKSAIPEKKAGQEFLELPNHLKGYYNGWNAAIDDMVTKAAPSTSPAKPPDELDDILYQYFVNEFATTGNKWLPNQALIASMKSDIHATEAKQRIRSYYRQHYHLQPKPSAEPEQSGSHDSVATGSATATTGVGEALAMQVLKQRLLAANLFTHDDAELGEDAFERLTVEAINKIMEEV